MYPFEVNVDGYKKELMLIPLSSELYDHLTFFSIKLLILF